MPTIEDALNRYAGYEMNSSAQCPECGRTIQRYDNFCSECGTRLTDPEEVTEFDLAASDSETGELLWNDDDESDSFSMERLYQGEEDEDIEDGMEDL